MPAGSSGGAPRRRHPGDDLAVTDDLVTSIRQRVVGTPTALLAERVAEEVGTLAPLAGARQRDRWTEQVLANLVGLGPLEPFLADPDVEEVMINAGTDLWINRAGRSIRVGSVRPDVFWTVSERVLAPLGLQLDRTRPVVDARLADGSRFAAVIPPVAIDGPCLSIRRFRIAAIALDQVASPEVADLLIDLIASRANVVVSGATASGKTTLLNSLLRLVPPHERIVTIEDTAELDLGERHVVRLEARPATADGQGGQSIRDLVRAALRLRPERLVVGEVRGSEALDMIDALSTGHDGSLATCHANGADDALGRLEFMCLQAAGDVPLAAVRDRVNRALDVVVHVARVGDARRISTITEVGPAGSPTRSRLLCEHDHVVGEPSRQRMRPGRAPSGESTTDPRAASPTKTNLR